MIETAKQQERAILVGVELQETENFDMSMEELASLAKTAGAEVVASYTQKRERYDSKSFVGSGKLEEIKAMVDTDEITTVIVNNRLTPRQNTNLEAAFGVKVIDRSIRNQIADIERQLKIVEKNRETIREKRVDSTTFKIGLIGYTNAGKSTIMNLMTDDKQYEANELFATLDATTKKIYLKDQFQVTLTDTVGFIQDLPTELVAAFKSTLEESRNVDLLLHVIDASDPNHEEHENVVLDILKELDMTDIPRLAIYNKMDVANNLVATVFPNVRLSARDKGSREALRKLLIDEIQQNFEHFSIKVNQDQAYKLYQLSQLALLDSYSFETEVEEITGYISPKNKWKLEEFYD